MAGVPRRPPRACRPRSTSGDRQPDDHHYLQQLRDRRAVTVYVDSFQRGDLENEADDKSLSLSESINLASQINNDTDQSLLHLQKDELEALKADLSILETMQNNQRFICSATSGDGTPTRQSQKNRRAPLAPAEKSMQSANLVEVKTVDGVDKETTGDSAEKQLAQQKAVTIEQVSLKSPSRRLGDLPSAVVTNEHSYPSAKPALKPKPSICSLRDTSPKKSDSLCNPKQISDVDTVSAELVSIPLENHNSKVSSPTYAVVDKSRKRSVRLELSQGSLVTSQSGDKKSQAGDEKSQVEGSSNAESNSKVPPKKPPRTFAHSEYMKVKGATLPASSSRSLKVSCDYEEIESVQQQLRELNKGGAPATVENNPEIESSSVSVDNLVIRRRQTNDKLPAPPRPPPPAISDIKRTSLFGGCVFPEKDNEPKFSRGSNHFRSSERIGKSDRRKPERSMSMQERRNCDRLKGEQGGKLSKAVEDDHDGSEGAADAEDSANVGRDSESSDTLTSEVYIGSPRQRTRAKIQNAYSILRLNTVLAGESDAASEISEESTIDSVAEELHKQFMVHVATVKQLTQKNVLKNLKIKREQSGHLFEFTLIVKLKMDADSNVYKPSAEFRYPDKECALVDSAVDFCFPDFVCWRPVSVYASESFMFVMTDVDGNRRFCYCRRYLPPGTGNRLPEGLCLMSLFNDVTFYTQLLNGLEERVQLQSNGVEAMHELLRSAHDLAFPMPNSDIHITTGSHDQKKTLVLCRASENRPDNVSFQCLLSTVSQESLAQIFASLLLERRIVFCAQKLSTLITSMQSLILVLYPFEWPHLFVPVLPASSIRIFSSSLPFVFGILSSTYAQLLRDNFSFSEMLVIDLDGGKFLNCYGDEQKIIPQKLQKALIGALRDDTDSAGVRDIAVTEAFLRFFVETCGHYTDYICTQQDGLGVFERELFIKAVSSRSIQMFLEWFTLTQMFDVFMAEELQGCKHAVFEARVLEYREEMAAEPLSSLRHNVKLVGKKIKDFFVESGGKIRKKWQHRNVFI